MENVSTKYSGVKKLRILVSIFSTQTFLHSCFRCHVYLGSRSGRFSSGFHGVVAKYFNWWPAKPLVVELIALRLSFQINLAYNFLEAHQQSSIKVPRAVWFLLRCFLKRSFLCLGTVIIIGVLFAIRQLQMNPPIFYSTLR